MKTLLCDEAAITRVVEVLGLSYERVAEVSLKGYRMVHLQNELFYLKKTDGQETCELVQIAMKDEEIWKLDQFQSSIVVKKKFVSVSDGTASDSDGTVSDSDGTASVSDGTVLDSDGTASDSDGTASVCEGTAADDDGNCFVYEKRNDETNPFDCVNVSKIKEYDDQKPPLGRCDLYLLIPGKLKKASGTWNGIPEHKCEVFDIFSQNITKCVDEEYNSNFSQRLNRKCVGEIQIEVTSPVDGKKYVQNAIAGIVEHETGFCILEIIIQNCAIGGNKLLESYCAGTIRFIYEWKTYSLPELLQVFNMRKFGKRRSLAFLYGDVSQEEMINALANEEYPMGKIAGDFSGKIMKENIAQYDTAEVYVSQETMLEKCRKMPIDSDERLLYHAIEIFFVELLLFQDAAIDKVYVDLQSEENKQTRYCDVQLATQRYEHIRLDMVKAMHFADYEQFNFPTVRASAKKVAACFGIEYVFDKYEANKQLLESMIGTNKRRLQEQQDEIKNRFLLLISAVATISTIGGIIYSVYTDAAGGLFAYSAALILTVAGYGIYRTVMHIWNKRRQSEKERVENDETKI